VGKIFWGVFESIVRSEDREYGEKWRCGIPGRWYAVGKGRVVTRINERLGIWNYQH